MKAFDEGCGPYLLLTVKRGPHADRTLVCCTCGCERTYKTRKKAQKRADAHLVLSNGVPSLSTEAAL